MTDKSTEYDEQIAYITQNPHKIKDDWFKAKGIFNFSGSAIQAGCPIQIKSEPKTFKVIINGIIYQELTDKIIADKRIPKKYEDIEVNNLSVFKEYQLLFDELRAKDKEKVK